MSAARNRTRSHSLITILLFCIAATLLAFILCACAAKDAQPTDPENGEINSVALETPESYESLYKMLQEKQGSSVNGSARGLLLEDTAATNEMAASGAAATASGSSDYSSTNVQVAGIDEGDRVKTDGSYIYSISDGDVVVTQADGDQTSVCCRFFLDEDGLHLGSSGQEESAGSFMPNDLFVSGSTLAVLYEDDFTDGHFRSAASKPIASVALVDVSNPEEPVLSATFGQDGILEASRLSDGKLVLVSSFWHYDVMSLGGLGAKSSGDDFVPNFYEGETSNAADIDRLFIAPDCRDFTFTVVSTIDLQQKKRIDNVSLAGACDNLYMSSNRLYLASTSYDTEESDPYHGSVYTVVDYTQKNTTHVSVFEFDDGAISPVGSVGFDGCLLNQFSLDEYEGNLRVATTVEKYSYRVLTDKTHDVESCQNVEDATYNSLLIFDSELNLASTIESLAPDESIYSVRFDGPVGYVVTYKQIDPLFAINLFDPRKPFVTSALKIPGFSRYLHPYSEDRLFGLGQSTETTVSGSERADGLKLSMFDISDPFDVTEKNKLVLEDAYSEALYDHHAIFVSAENDLIGFPASSEYLLYGYSDDAGFYERARIDTTVFSEGVASDSAGGDASTAIYMGTGTRALFIADSLYVVGDNGMYVLELNTLAEEATVSFAGN